MMDTREKGTDFTQLLCPLIDRTCEKEHCAAYNQWEDNYYIITERHDTILETGTKTQFLSDKPKIQYHIIDAHITKKTHYKTQECLQYKHRHKTETDTPIDIETTIHGTKPTYPEQYIGHTLEDNKTITTTTTLTPDKEGCWATQP